MSPYCISRKLARRVRVGIQQRVFPYVMQTSLSADQTPTYRPVFSFFLLSFLLFLVEFRPRGSPVVYIMSCSLEERSHRRAGPFPLSLFCSDLPQPQSCGVPLPPLLCPLWKLKTYPNALKRTLVPYRRLSRQAFDPVHQLVHLFPATSPDPAHALLSQRS